MENPNDHLDEFVNKCGIVKYQGISDEQMKLICFPYSLRAEARDWLRSKGPNKYRTWEALSKAFLSRFFYHPKLLNYIMISPHSVKKMVKHYMRLGKNIKGYKGSARTMES